MTQAALQQDQGRTNKPLVAWLAHALTFLPLLYCWGCKPEVESVPLSFNVSNPKYLEFYSLTRLPDEHHKVAILGPRGLQWYREDKPVFNLSHCATNRTSWGKLPNGNYMINLYIAETHQEHLSEWTRSHQDSHSGIVLDGQLIVVEPIKVELRTVIGIEAFATQAEAVRVCEAIKRGGH